MTKKSNMATQHDATNALTEADLSKVVGGQQGGAPMQIGPDGDPVTSTPTYDI
jgi:hypothetical protein